MTTIEYGSQWRFLRPSTNGRKGDRALRGRLLRRITVSDNLPTRAARTNRSSDRLVVVPTPTAADHGIRVIGPYDRYLKRPFDIIAASLLILLLTPILVVVAVCVRIWLGPQIFFHQERVGRNGRIFGMIKFRSMLHDRRSERANSGPFEGSDRRQTHKSINDPRHTPVGRFIRKWSLDELPQLFNVVRGDMSLVGPRPELVKVAMAQNLMDHPRHLVRPGITGLWQVSRNRSNLLHEDVSLDAEYVERVTFLGDMKILLKTFGAVLRARGR